MALPRLATGIDEVERGRAVDAGMVLHAAKSTMGICLQPQDDSLELCTWPAALKPQAEALYRIGRAQRLMAFVAEHPGAWQASPAVHLAFHNARPAQRLHLDCHLDIAEYVRRWSGDDFAESGRTATTRSERTCGPGFGSASTSAPKMTSGSMHSASASATATSICVPPAPPSMRSLPTPTNAKPTFVKSNATAGPCPKAPTADATARPSLPARHG